MISSPVFLVGAERSGTTMLRLMLDGHPEIAFAEEFEYSVQHLVEQDWPVRHHTKGPWPELDGYREWLAHDRVFLLNDHDVHSADTYPELVDNFFEAVTNDPPDAVVRGATVHFGIQYILDLWPDAKFIHIIRDPREIAPSHIRMGFAGNAWHALDKWFQAEDAIAEVRNLLDDDPTRIMNVRFDHLVQNYMKELDRIVEFLGIEYHEAMLSYPERTDYELPQAAETWTRTKPLSDADTQLVESRVGARLTQYGFEPSGLAPMKVNGLRRKWLRVDNKLRRPQHRALVVGWPQVAAEIVAIRLPGSIGEKIAKRVFARSDDRINSGRRKSWS